jgi:hypothetical protein
MDQKKSIIIIQDLGLLAASRHSISGQPILRVIFRNFLFLETFLFLEKTYFLMFFRNFFRISVGSQYPE